VSISVDGKWRVVGVYKDEAVILIVITMTLIHVRISVDGKRQFVGVLKGDNYNTT
jgi:hypothetical protein